MKQQRRMIASNDQRAREIICRWLLLCFFYSIGETLGKRLFFAKNGSLKYKKAVLLLKIGFLKQKLVRIVYL